MHGLLNRLVNNIGVQFEQSTETGGNGRAEMSDMIFFVLVEANTPHESNLNLVSHGNRMKQPLAGQTALLRDRQQRRDVITRMRIIRSEKSVVHVQFAHGDTVGPGRPFRRIGAVDAEDPRPLPRAGWASAC